VVTGVVVVVVAVGVTLFRCGNRVFLLVMTGDGDDDKGIRVCAPVLCRLFMVKAIPLAKQQKNKICNAAAPTENLNTVDGAGQENPRCGRTMTC
jgi:hypothetical protein